MDWCSSSSACSSKSAVEWSPCGRRLQRICNKKTRVCTSTHALQWNVLLRCLVFTVAHGSNVQPHCATLAVELCPKLLISADALVLAPFRSKSGERRRGAPPNSLVAGILLGYGQPPSELGCRHTRRTPSENTPAVCNRRLGHQIKNTHRENTHREHSHSPTFSVLECLYLCGFSQQLVPDYLADTNGGLIDMGSGQLSQRDPARTIQYTVDHTGKCLNKAWL